MKLHYDITGSGQAIVILHGMFGNLSNWKSVANALSETHEVITMDLRNHGNSNSSDTMNYQLMAEDVAETLNELNKTNIILIGHSMGGKVAIQFTHNYPEIVEKLIVVDIFPKAYPKRHQLIFKALMALSLNDIKSRSEADEILKATISDIAIRAFLLKSLIRTTLSFEWVFSLNNIYKNYQEICNNVELTNTVNTPVYFIKGGLSDYIQDYDTHELLVNSKRITIPTANHWIHAHKYDLFLKELHHILQIKN